MTLNMRANGVRSLDVRTRGPIMSDAEAVATPFQTLSQGGNLIKELPAGPAVVPPINGSVCALGGRAF
jgi:hypothetical protein